MNEHCRDLVPFVDGELEPERADAFRSHLQSCDACRAGLVEAMQLSARLGALQPAPEKLAPQLTALAGSKEVLSTAPAGEPRSPTRWKRRITRWGPVAVAAVGLLVVFRPRPPSEQGSDPLAELKDRPYEIRLAYPGAAAYRPVRGQMLGPAGSTGESIPYAVLDTFQKRRNDYALEIARFLNGESVTGVAEKLRKLDPTPAIRSDLAAIEILTTNNDNADAILADLERLQRSPDPAVARAARWNYAILLTRLDLPLGAAQVFRAIAGDNEPGWADEARSRAEPLEQRAKTFQDTWKRASQAGQALVETGAPVPSELVRAFPSLLRAYFYNAVRAAPSRERVQALASMAAELDQIAEQHALGDYVQRVTKADFHHRAPFANAYAQLLQRKPLSAELEAQIAAASPSGDVMDIVMGAMDQQRTVADHLESFGKMTALADDPWFEIVLAQAGATVDVRHSNWLGAEARLRKAEKLCGPSVNYRCLELERQLGKLYADLHRVHESLTVLQAALHTARSAGEWGRYPGLLWELADTERFHSATATVRAYANEYLLMVDGCDDQRWAHRTLAGAALLDVDGKAARAHLVEALRCGDPDLRVANYLTDIARLDPQPGDLAQLQSLLGKARASGQLSVAEQVLADEIEGRLLIEGDRAAGIAELEKAIAASETMPREVGANKARAGAYSVLVLDAARHGDHTRALTLIAQDLGLPPPGACTVGMIAEDERAAIAVRGSDGKDRGEYSADRGPSPAAPTVSAELVKSLSTCASVQVMAPAALQGTARVLPTELAWSYATGARERARARAKPSTAPRALMVTNVTPPAYLQLHPLSVQPSYAGPSTTILSGPDATPARVLAEMVDASEIQFHTHALLDVGVSDASHLVLSPGPDGGYALTAEAIRGIELRSHPIVVLAACHSAQGARYQHAPWSLPDAFLAVGARAVFAAARDIPDLEAGPFFARVLARVRSGEPPAAALRDERQAALASDPWVADVVVFE